MSIISSTTKSYIAGFLDGDGCIMFQLIYRKDYKYGYQIRASIVFYQKASISNYKHLGWIKSIFKNGYIRKRNDDMIEYTIVGIEPVIKILKLLSPYLKLKRKHVELAIRINNILKEKFNLNNFLKAAKLVDKFEELNYSKKRTNTSKKLEIYLRQHKLYPRND